MAFRSFLTNLKRAKLELRAKDHQWRQTNSYHRLSRPFFNDDKVKPESELEREIMKLNHSNGCVTTVLQEWTKKSARVSFGDLQRISAKLMRFKRYDLTAQITDWLESLTTHEIHPEYYAIKTQLIVETKGLNEAEEYFNSLKGSAALKAASLPLLRGYVKLRETARAEAFMAKLNESGLIVNVHPYNEMMKLYTATSELKKVGLVVIEMKKNRIPLNVLSYNLWMSACQEANEVESVERVYQEMLRDEGVEIGWSSLSTVANAYVKAGWVDKATRVLRIAEQKLSSSHRLGFSFLMTQHASLKNKEDVIRLWKLCKKATGERVTCALYMSVILCWVKMGDLGEAERLFGEWEANRMGYDIRVSNVLLGAYARNKSMDKAEALLYRTMEGGGRPNFKTWEILAEGWVRVENMEKAIDAMKRVFSMLKHCHWRPSDEIVMAIAGYYEEHGDLEAANRYVKTAHEFGFASLPLYESLLRIHSSTQTPALEIHKMMEKDGFERDCEGYDLIKATNG